MNNIKLTPLEQRVYDYLKLHKSITVKECFEDCGTTELRKIMSNFREKGFVVKDIWESVFDRYGNETYIKRYFIAERKCKNDK